MDNKVFTKNEENLHAKHLEGSPKRGCLRQVSHLPPFKHTTGYHTSGAKFAVSRLSLVTETAYHVHILLALRLSGVTVVYYLGMFAFYVQCLTVAGVSQPSSNVAAEIRNSQDPQTF